jgi:hypothetical protein
MMESLRSIFYKKDRIHSFHIRYSLFLSFFKDQTGRPPKAGKLFWPAAPLTPEL